MEYHILDTETCGLDGGVCEIAWLRVDDDLNILDQHLARINPERPISPGAFAVHGISDADVEGCPTMVEIAQLLPEPINIVGHNVSFDIRMTAPHIQVRSSLCTLSLARQYIKGTTNHKLPTLKSELGLTEQTSHSALGDVLTVRDLLLHLLPLTGRSLQQLVTLQTAPKVIHRIPYGMHKGKLITELPASYCEWFLRQRDIDPDLRYSFNILRKIR